MSILGLQIWFKCKICNLFAMEKNAMETISITMINVHSNFLFKCFNIKPQSAFEIEYIPLNCLSAFLAFSSLYTAHHSGMTASKPEVVFFLGTAQSKLCPHICEWFVSDAPKNPPRAPRGKNTLWPVSKLTRLYRVELCWWEEVRRAFAPPSCTSFNDLRCKCARVHCKQSSRILFFLGTKHSSYIAPAQILFA